MFPPEFLYFHLYPTYFPFWPILLLPLLNYPFEAESFETCNFFHNDVPIHRIVSNGILGSYTVEISIIRICNIRGLNLTTKKEKRICVSSGDGARKFVRRVVSIWTLEIYRTLLGSRPNQRELRLRFEYDDFFFPLFDFTLSIHVDIRHCMEWKFKIPRKTPFYIQIRFNLFVEQVR